MCPNFSRAIKKNGNLIVQVWRVWKVDQSFLFKHLDSGLNGNIKKNIAMLQVDGLALHKLFVGSIQWLKVKISIDRFVVGKKSFWKMVLSQPYHTIIIF